MQNLEVEIKFHLEDPGAIREAILNLGVSSSGRFFETNHILDSPGHTLHKRNSLLRLRQDKHTRLTFKSPAPGTDTAFKIRRELEVQVNDFATMQQILGKIGFKTVRIYEKYRETFKYHDTHLCLDTLPYGDFLEIEGHRKDIVDLSAKLGLHWPRRSLLNYHELFELAKAEYRLTFSDITFANFEGITIDMLQFVNRFEAGA